jgi:multisubunit Na+/H+ antiporter MnhB subunit
MFGIAVLLLALAGVLAFHRQRLLAILYLSVVGLVVSLAFIRLSAPDLALTQLSVEVASIILLLLALRFLPQEGPIEEAKSRQLRDAAVAAGAGLGVSALAYAMLTRPFETISAYHIANSKPLGGGTNVVNVTLVEYRGKTYKRRSPENKFGAAIWFSRSVGKDEEGQNQYEKFITFKEMAPAEPLSRAAEAKTRAGKPALRASGIAILYWSAIASVPSITSSSTSVATIAPLLSRFRRFNPARTPAGTAVSSFS